MQELQLLHSARRLMLIDIYIKFHEDSLNGFQTIEVKLFCYRQSSHNSKQYKWKSYDSWTLHVV